MSPPAFEPVAVVVRLDTVKPERVRWLWHGHLPLGKVTLLDGLPDMGKSTIAIDLAARVTLGAAMPDETAGLERPAAVVLLSAEDGLDDTVVPRLLAAGGDPSRVHVVKAVRESARGRLVDAWPDLDRHLAALRRLVADTGAQLVIIDVLMAYLGEKVNAYRDQDMRRVLGPLGAMAADLGCAVLLLRHPTKIGSPNAVLNGGGSIGIIGAVRTGLLVGFDPDDNQEDLNLRRRLLAVSKCNLAPKAPTLAYQLESDPEHGCAHIAWLGSTRHRADDLLVDRSERQEQNAREAWLRDFLADGPVPAKDVEKEAQANGWTLNQVRPTLKRLGGRSVKQGGNFGGDPSWVWTLTP